MKKTVLLIDDEVELLGVVSFRLSASGYKVYSANSGKQGLKLASKYKPDVILLDIMMPDMDGYEVLKRLKKSKKTLTIPVIMLTAKSDEKSILKASGLYDEGYIVKPFESSELLSKIEEVLQRR